MKIQNSCLNPRLPILKLIAIMLLFAT